VRRPTSRRLGESLTALLAAADGVPATSTGAAYAVLLPVTTPSSHVDAVQLTRVLVSAGEQRHAGTIAARLSALAAAHPGFPFLEASATHARALVDADADLAVKAADGHADDPRPLARAAAQEDAGRLLPPTARHEAIAQLTEALALYVAAGADLDAVRVRALLRARGVRRPADRRQPGPHVWPELTGAQVRVAHLAAAGSTNRAIAERLHLSPHTVNSHLRHVFGKLGIRSRVELTRIVTERSHQRSGFESHG
jgi:DNA-binding CsgD family transcriptional regulator